MAKITNLFRDKLYTISRSSEVFEIEKEIIEYIFELHDLKCKSIKFIDANINNDLFQTADSDDQEYYIKLSLEENPKFLIEGRILAENALKKISPCPFASGTIKKFGNINYSLLSSIPTQNVKEYGLVTIVKNNELISNLFLDLSSFTTYDCQIQSIDDYLNYYLNFDISQITKINFNTPEADPKIKGLIQNQTHLLQKHLKEKLGKINFKKQNFCHGNLNQSTILPFDDSLCCINFENAYLGDALFEILNLRYQFYYNELVEVKIIENFQAKSKEKLNLKFINQYKEFVNYWNLYKICVDYLNEVFLLQSKRMNKILDLAFCLSKNYENFYGLPDFEKNFKPIAELFVESVI